ncbi:MAG: isochorismate synthase MenF [Rhodoluna sp.]
MPLKVITRAVSAQELGVSNLTDLLGSASSCFIKDGSGLIGWGEALRLTASGPNRFEQLDKAWRESVAQAEIDNSSELPGSGLMAFGSMAFSDQSSTESILIVPKLIIGFENSEFFLTTVNSSEEEALRLIKQPEHVEHLEFHSGVISPELFSENVAVALELIGTGKLSKIVLARDLVATFSNFNPNQALQKLSTKYSSCYTYLVDGMFGASPELLVSVDAGLVSARVLAGTAGRGTDVEVDVAIGQALAHSHKNLIEHKFAIDSLTAAMQADCKDIEFSQEPFSLALPNLWHLASDVSAELKENTTSLKLLSALHPSAAVAGTPREFALEKILEIENTDRGRYAGPIGWVGANGDGVWAIALRGAQITENQIRAFAGCGIVSESDAESELAETNLKFKAILENL